MAIKSREEILKQINDKFGDDTSDETLALIEDITDTFDELTKQSTDSTDWKQKYEENDKAWRTKYKERFMSPSVEDSAENEDEKEDAEPNIPMTFDELFKTE